MTSPLVGLSSHQIQKLACPECRSSLKVVDNQLLCSGGHGFAIVNGVPVLLRRATLKLIEDARDRAENVQLRRSLARHPVLLRTLDAIRPPHPFTFMRWRVSRRIRRRFSDLVVRMSPPQDATFLDVGSGILGDKNASGLSSFIRSHTIALEIDSIGGVGVVADAHDLPWQSRSLDGALIQGVLEHVQRPERVVAEIFRVLKAGAPVYAEVPFHQHYHLDPLDFRRWTSYGFDELFASFERIESGVCAGPASALTDLLTEFPALLFARPRAYWAAKVVSGWLFSPLQLLDAVWSTRPRAHVAAGAVYFLGSKPRAGA